jgi:glycerophosphoryl diester phosphodiesterase
MLDSLENVYRNRILNFGHQGANAAAPGNTLAAFRLAAEMGADGIELDVQLSRDGEAVVIHDFTVDRTTDGQGAVRRMTLAQLKKLDAGSWFDAAFAGERIPTLQEVFDAVAHRLLINVEIKRPVARSGGLEAEVVRLIEDNNLAHRVIVSSFNPLSLRKVKRLNPNILTALLCAPDQPLWLRRAWLGPIAPHEFRHPHYSMVDERFMAWAVQRDYRVNTWTVDEPDEMRRLVKLGVHGIITNCPDLLAEILAEE